MKKRDYELSRTRKQLLRYKNNGKKELTWKLNKKQIEILRMMEIKFEPYLYSIKTQKLYNIRSIESPLLKEIHYKNKQGHSYYVCRLNSEEKKLLNDYNISYKVKKYKIHLN